MHQDSIERIGRAYVAKRKIYSFKSYLRVMHRNALFDVMRDIYCTSKVGKVYV